jgi:hypothetical protein
MFLITRELIGGWEMDREAVDVTSSNAAVKRENLAAVTVVWFGSAKIADN